MGRLPSRLDPPLLFAHRGARAHAADNTLEAFRLAIRLGATGLETDAWLTGDGEVVLDHDGVVRNGRRRRPISEVARSALPAHIPTLGELYDEVGTALPLSIDVKDTAVAPAIIAVAREHDAEDRLWLCAQGDWRLAAEWRHLSDGVHLVDSSRLRSMKEGTERRARALADAGIDAVNMHVDDWSGGLTTLFHRFERLAFGWDAQFERQISALRDMGIDAIYSDHVDRMVAVVGR